MPLRLSAKRMTSSRCVPILKTGLKEDSGSCMISENAVPLSASRSLRGMASTSRPSMTMVPEAIVAFFGKVPMIALAVTDLPDPVSPISATRSPAETVKATSRSTWRVRP
ncbi:hypothetical protein D3C71_456810 [compost metagenome]